jgi:hypothetical protein
MNHRVFTNNRTVWEGTVSVQGITSGDGTSNTVIFAEISARKNGNYGSLWAHGNWDYPHMASFNYESGTPQPKEANPDNYAHDRAHCLTAGGCQVLMADGGVRNVSSSISLVNWTAMCTYMAGDIVQGN